ncbi:F0F1 ATP synthase subunit delta [Actinocorallia longicatena]|uniref:ATP synthase subunit delta n=1 Tax=Actinocorallia longicatena TaxID=111803 RepID=A0ABP6QJS1_9ACTN
MAGAVSRASLAEITDNFANFSKNADATVLGAELLEILHLLDREHGLRRALSDPAKPGEEKANIAQALFEGKVSAPALAILKDVVSRKWSRPSELTDAVEQLAIGSYALAAEQNGTLDDLEDELFRFSRLVEGEPELRNALAGQRLPAERKTELVSALIADKVAAPSLALINEVVTNPRGRSLERGLAEIGKNIATRRNRLVATVRTAVALTDEQQTRLAAALGASYGRGVHLNIEIDPTVIGGLAVQLGDEAIDGTIAGRLDGVRRRIAS